MSVFYWHDGVVYGSSGQELAWCSWEVAQTIASAEALGLPSATLVRGLPPRKGR